MIKIAVGKFISDRMWFGWHYSVVARSGGDGGKVHEQYGWNRSQQYKRVPVRTNDYRCPPPWGSF